MLHSFLSLLIFLLPSTFYADDIREFSVTLEANESPPFWSKKLPYNGMAGEIVNAISEAAGIESKIVFKPLSRLIEDDTNNDLGNPAFFMDNQDFADIVPIAFYHASIYYYAPNHKSPLEVKSLDDLKKMKIGVLKGTLVDRLYFKKEGLKFEESYSHESLFKKLKLGRIDMIIEIELVSQQIVKRLFSSEVDNFVSIPLKSSSHPIAIMLAQEYPNAKEIGQVYREGLKEIIQNGTYEDILEKYYAKDRIPNRWFIDLERFNQLYKIDDGE